MKLNTRKPNATALKIQLCATVMFAEKGYEGTIMDELTERTGVNKASIYYHFRDKATLYEHCLTQLFASVAAPVADAVDQASTPHEKLATFIQSFAEQAREKPAMPSILMREIASGGQHMPDTARQQMQRLLSTLKNLLNQGQQEGIFESFNALTPHFMVIGSLCFFLTSQPMRDRIDSPEKIDPELNEFTHQLIQILQSGLAKTTKGA